MPVAVMMRCSVTSAAVLLAMPVSAQTPPAATPLVTIVQPPPVVTVAPPTSTDGRYFGHLPYPQAPRDMMAAMSDQFAPGKSCELHRDAAPALYRLMFAAQAEGIVGLRAISCYRTVAHQTNLFCGAGLLGPCRDPAERARSVAPGGYSEHATGYVVDFGAPAPLGCNDLDPCMSGTQGGLWLMRNAPKYGFELSFPPGNKQGVTWEPWHWRWVGVSADEPGARQARAVFARARKDFPADPRSADTPAAPVKLKPVDPNRFVGPRF
jgi:D-alanyl-D-alanine carboxypeptidase